MEADSQLCAISSPVFLNFFSKKIRVGINYTESRHKPFSKGVFRFTYTFILFRNFSSNKSHFGFYSNLLSSFVFFKQMSYTNK